MDNIAEEAEEVVLQEEIKDKDGNITQELIKEKNIITPEESVMTKDLNNDQMLMNMFGTVRKLQMMVEDLQKQLNENVKE